MAMVFQDPMTSLNPVMKIGRQITESLVHHLSMDKNEARETALALLQSVGIPEPEQRLNEYPHQLSGGMRQRVTIAIALACGPKILFADEPTTALDVTVQAQILNLLARQQSERHMAMILVTHDLGVVAGRTDDIAVMYAGKIVEQAPTSVLFDKMKMPYTEALVSSIPKLANPSHTRLEIIPGRPPDLVHPPRGCNFAPRCKYVQPKCIEEPPPLVQAETPGHLYRCWFPVDTPEGREHASARNQADQTNRAVAPVGPRPCPSRCRGELTWPAAAPPHICARPEDTSPAGREPGGRVPGGLHRPQGPRRHRREHRRARGRDPRPGGRVGLRQVDHRPRHDAAAAPHVSGSAWSTGART